jgi:ATP-dependent DNA helicase PIF1
LSTPQWSVDIPTIQTLITQSDNGDGPSSSFDAAADFVPFQSTVEATDPELSTQQSEILRRIKEGENFFFTGSAGTGKSVLLRAIIKAFHEKNLEEARNAPGLHERLMQEYLNSDRKAPPPRMEKVERWKLGVTASTGMAGV